METLLLILRWAAALFLFRMAVMFPLVFWKRREPGARDWVLGVILAAITGTLGFGLITWDWQPLWLAARCAVALILAILAISVIHALHRGGEQTLRLRLLFVCFGCALVMPVISIVLLDWRWLLAAGGFLVLTAALMMLGWLTNRKQETAALWEMGGKARGSPLTAGEAKQRLALGETVAPGATLEEMRLGRAPTSAEVEAFAVEQTEAFARLDTEQQEQQEQWAREREAGKTDIVVARVRRPLL